MVTAPAHTRSGGGEAVMFYPNVDHSNHINLERMLRDVCNAFKVEVVDVPSYALLPEEEKQLYAKTFSNETLYVRSLPDKLVLTRSPFLIDAKTIVRKDTDNVAIELSSFYFNLQRSKDGIRVFYLYVDDKERGLEEEKLKIFSPFWTYPSAIFIQPRWKDANRERFQKYAHVIKEHFENSLFYTIHIYEQQTAGSQDPFLLIPRQTVNEHSVGLLSLLRR